jgi:hypothetical protein
MTTSEPHECIEVEVVGGFVEQQQVRRAHQRARELQAHAPAAGKAVHRRVELRRLEAQAEQQRLRPCACIEGAGLFERQVRMRHGFAVVSGLGGSKFLLRREQGQIAVEHVAGSPLAGLGHVLRDFADAPLRRQIDIAGVGMQAVRQQCEQARLAGAVAADEACLLSGVEREARALQHDLGAAAQGDVAHGDHVAAFASVWSIASSWPRTASVIMARRYVLTAGPRA